MSTGTYAPTATLPRLLAGVPESGAMSLREHLQVHGEPPFGRITIGASESLIAGIEQAGLLGRGGASFPAGTKLRALLSASNGRSAGMRARAAQPIVVVNATEGEPASLKDKTLLEALPHLVVDGAALAARSIGADEAIICVCMEAGAARAALVRALGERSHDANGTIRIQIALITPGYVTGQETAVVNFLNGRPARPTFTPPLPFERGVQGRPTLVNNPETLAHLALIARYGPGWFRQLGTASQPGSALVTLWGAVQAPGVYEIECGASLDSLLNAGGGCTEAVRAALIGGYAGGWVDGRELSVLTLADDHLAGHGTRFGPGVVAVLGERNCGVAETVRLVRWLADQSAGQCGPCVHGLAAMAAALEQTQSGIVQSKRPARLEQLTELVQRRGACAHPDGTANLVRSALKVFATEIAEHSHHGPCAGCDAEPVLPLPAAFGPAARPTGAQPTKSVRFRAQQGTPGALPAGSSGQAFSARSDHAAQRAARRRRARR